MTQISTPEAIVVDSPPNVDEIGITPLNHSFGLPVDLLETPTADSTVSPIVRFGAVVDTPEAEEDETDLTVEGTTIIIMMKLIIRTIGLPL